MDLRRLRTFVAVTELGTVSKAALRLRISQSALSRQISDLERELRVRLFDRVGRRLVPTAIGEELLEDCRGVLAQVRSLGERAELLRGVDPRLASLPLQPDEVLAASAPSLHVGTTEAIDIRSLASYPLLLL